jgi:hypothetical protein
MMDVMSFKEKLSKVQLLIRLIFTTGPFGFREARGKAWAPSSPERQPEAPR